MFAVMACEADETIQNVVKSSWLIFSAGSFYQLALRRDGARNGFLKCHVCVRS